MPPALKRWRGPFSPPAAITSSTPWARSAGRPIWPSLSGGAPHAQTPRLELENWLTAQNWDFYRELWAGYERVSDTEYSWLWRRCGDRALPIRAQAAVEQLDGGMVQITVSARGERNVHRGSGNRTTRRLPAAGGPFVSLGRRLVSFGTPVFGDMPGWGEPAGGGRAYLPVRVENGSGTVTLWAQDNAYVRLTVQSAEVVRALPAMDPGVSGAGRKKGFEAMDKTRGVARGGPCAGAGGIPGGVRAAAAGGDERFLAAGGYVETDLLQHYAGWLAIKNQGLSWPLTFTAGLDWPVGARPPWPTAFRCWRCLWPCSRLAARYLSVFWVVCVRQPDAAGEAAVRLVRLFTKRAPCVLAGAALLCVSPVLLERAFRHTALSAHWLILYALYLYFKSARGGFAKMPAGGFIALAALAAAIHLYFVPMVLAIALACGISAGLAARSWRGPLWGGSAALAALAAAWALGFFSVKGSEAGGYGALA